MDWSPQQARALDSVGRWLKSKDKPVFQLGGWAGTGKSTLAKHLSATVDKPVYNAAYTGKAAHVLRKKGATNVSTIHKLIYQPKEKSKQHLREMEDERAEYLTHNPVPTKLIRQLEEGIAREKANLTRPSFQLNLESPLLDAGLLVVDEYSMIDQQMGEDLLTFGCPILALGDPGQLPPVKGTPYFNGDADITLTEIHRQAADNPIIWMSKQIREGSPLKAGNYGDSRVVDSDDVPRSELASMVLSTDQLLVGRNTTRIASNRRVRELMCHPGTLPVSGDRLVCLRNNHETGILNGQIWTVASLDNNHGDVVDLTLDGEDGERVGVTAHHHYFEGRTPDYWALKDAEAFDYGYALTVHKAQGSQWNNVVLFDEWHMRDRRKWLYTAVTRAAEKIDIIRM